GVGRNWRMACGLAAGLLTAPAAVAAPPDGTALLERRWQQLNRELQELALPTPPPPPAAGQRALSLEAALAIAFAANPDLQAQRELVAAAEADLQAAEGSYWPRLRAVAGSGALWEKDLLVAPVSNDNLGFGPLFSPKGLLAADGRPTAGPFYVPAGGRVAFDTTSRGASAGLQLDYDLLDFRRPPSVAAVKARLTSLRNTYGSQLRQLQLQVSEAYYQLQQADQTVRIQEAAVRNDAVILADARDLKRAGLAPRLDVLRRQAIEAGDRQLLIQAEADRTVARRQLAVLLRLGSQDTPLASDPITLLPPWPLDLEASLRAAVDDNPELDALLASRTALLRQRQATRAGLLPRLALVAGAGVGTGTARTDDIRLGGGGCCGSTVLPVQNTRSGDWSLGLNLNWLLFDGGTIAAQALSLERQAAAVQQQLTARRDVIQLRLETAFVNHTASLARLEAAQQEVAAGLEAFRDVRLRYQSGLSSETDLSVTQERL
ncbi:MAG: TolC family protein, partial [Chitinophagia bacterium]|nr:TolC family protein [Chitinophagia bacterium]